MSKATNKKTTPATKPARLYTAANIRAAYRDYREKCAAATDAGLAVSDAGRAVTRARDALDNATADHKGACDAANAAECLLGSLMLAGGFSKVRIGGDKVLLTTTGIQVIADDTPDLSE